jgi:restriction system protein
MLGIRHTAVRRPHPNTPFDTSRILSRAFGVTVSLPSYQDMMLPILRNASDGREHSGREAIEPAVFAFQLTEDQRTELLPSGQQPFLDNRANWARFYMTKAGLLVTTRRGFHRITERGLKVLRENPSHINTDVLSQFPEFIQFKSMKKPDTGQEYDLVEVIDKTPQESIEFGYQKLRGDLEAQLLDSVKSCSPGFFERLVVELLLT